MKQRGFTLIELLVVLIILSITFGFAMFAFGDFGKSRQAEMTAQQVQHLIRELREEAILNVSDLTVHIDRVGLTQNAKPTHFPTGIIATPTLTLHLHASGEITPFHLHFGTPSKPNLVILTGEANGHLTLTKP